MAKKKTHIRANGKKKVKEEAKVHRIWHHPLFTPGLIILLAFFLRLPNFTASLWYDEVCYTFVNLKESHIARVLFHDVHPPLYPLFIRGWIALFGDGEIAIRTPSLIFGLVSIALTYAVAKRWFGQMTAILASVLLALSPFHIWYSQEAKTNMLLLLLTMVALWGLQQAWTTNQRRYWYLFMAASVLSLWTNHFALWAFVASMAWLWFQVLTAEGRIRLRWIAASTIIISLAYLPALLLTTLQINDLGRGYLRPFSPLEVYNLFLIYLSHGNTLRTVFPWTLARSLQTQPGAYFFLEIFFLFILLRGSWIVSRGWWIRLRVKDGIAIPSAGSELILFHLIVPPLILLAVSLFRPQIYVERSMIFLLPPYLMLLACGALSFEKVQWRALTAMILLLLGGISLYNLWGPKAEAWTVWMPKPDWRAATSYVDGELSASRERFLIFQVNPETSLVYYYDRLRHSGDARMDRNYPVDLPVVYLKKCGMDEIDGHLSRTGIRKVYFVHNHQWSGAFFRVMNSVRKDPRFHLTDVAQFPGITIYRFSVSQA